MDPIAEIKHLKKEYGQRLTILAHYYQRDEVYELADVTGDSYKLALEASRARAEYIIFCGVSFMAESARILARPDQRVLLPDHEAGCPLADMVTAKECVRALDDIRALSSRPVTPVLYINSSAAVKAAVGNAEGVTCTSSNAEWIVRSLLEEGRTVFFLPDGNLGINTARGLGLGEAEIAVFKRGRLNENAASSARFFIWDGFCNVHARFTVTDIVKAKSRHPYALIVVHPECPENVVARADFAGSTSGIMAKVACARAGDVVYVGTELNLVRRLAASRSDIQVLPLRESGCMNMNKITPAKVLDAVRSLKESASPFEVTVNEAEAAGARRALSGMIERVERERKKT